MAVLMLVTCVLLTERQLSYWRDSESLFRHALEVEDSDTAHISLGGVLRDQNRPNEALTQYIMAWRIHPGSVLANANVAGILAEQDKPALAEVYYQRAVQHNTWLPSANENYGRVLVTLKRYDEAMKQFEAAEKIEPTEAKPHFLMGRLWLKQGHDVEAVKELRAAIKLEPDNLEMLVLTATVLASSENSQARNGSEARRIGRTGGKADPKPASRRAGRAGHELRGNWEVCGGPCWWNSKPSSWPKRPVSRTGWNCCKNGCNFTNRIKHGGNRSRIIEAGVELVLF